MKTAIELIAEERKRQIDVEGWTPEHDDTHVKDEIPRAAAAYCLPHKWKIDHRHVGSNLFSLFQMFRSDIWPWNYSFWKPTPDDRIRELTKAGALIVAEIERLQRVKEKETI